LNFEPGIEPGKEKRMDEKKNWMLKGVFYECCRVEDGHCALWFGRDLPRACANMATYQIKEGRIQDVDMKGVVIMQHQEGIGPRVADMAKGAEEGASYVSDNANDEQRGVLELFLRENLGIRPWKKLLGIKFVKIDIQEENGRFYISMPHGEQKMSLTVGGDGKTPIRLENPLSPAFSNVRFCNTERWRYFDYGKDLDFHNTSGVIAEFVFGKI
jgi:hypothetical protein